MRHEGAALSDGVIPLDRRWLASHPLPIHGDNTTKNSRGCVVVVGGSLTVPGGILLPAEAALRVGAGKVRIGTIAETAITIGVAMPEAGVIALPGEDGEIALGAEALLQRTLDRSDVLLLGPAISDRDRAGALAERLLGDKAAFACILDGAAVAGAQICAAALPACGRALVLTPHYGEMAVLMGVEERAIAERPEHHARAAAVRFNAVVALKGSQTVIAAPERSLLRYAGGGVGLATGGSGDVLAGAIAGLLARGADPLTATCWGVWLHGKAGRRAASDIGDIGFLARELLPLLPSIMASLAGSTE
ncbi:MAG: NAD(P)H-hydrate dehydratase [Sphingomonadaceae bacterium]|nr:NAD(P)H-hydrate dehydratase [Sphingomonadaceae bacterium]